MPTTIPIMRRNVSCVRAHIVDLYVLPEPASSRPTTVTVLLSHPFDVLLYSLSHCASLSTAPNDPYPAQARDTSSVTADTQLREELVNHGTRYVHPPTALGYPLASPRPSKSSSSASWRWWNLSATRRWQPVTAGRPPGRVSGLFPSPLTSLALHASRCPPRSLHPPSQSPSTLQCARPHFGRPPADRAARPVRCITSRGHVVLLTPLHPSPRHVSAL